MSGAFPFLEQSIQSIHYCLYKIAAINCMLHSAILATTNNTAIKYDNITQQRQCSLHSASPFCKFTVLN